MDRYPSGLDPRIVQLREENKQRIMGILKQMIESGEIKSSRYYFEPNLTENEKLEKMQRWWEDYKFHLRFAVRDP